MNTNPNETLERNLVVLRLRVSFLFWTQVRGREGGEKEIGGGVQIGAVPEGSGLKESHCQASCSSLELDA